MRAPEMTREGAEPEGGAPDARELCAETESTGLLNVSCRNEFT